MKEQGVFTTLPWNKFEIKEARDGDLGGKGVPQSLRAFARVVVCDSEDELNWWLKTSQMDGGLMDRATIKNMEKVDAAHLFLYNEISQLVERHKRCIAELIPTHPAAGVARRKLAQQLLENEARVMQSVCVWLNFYRRIVLS
ncbi:hypothetical protein ACS0TY_012042 [Phlomoides rotata]